MTKSSVAKRKKWANRAVALRSEPNPFNRADGRGIHSLIHRFLPFYHC